MTKSFTLTPEAAAALRAVLRCKLEMWDHALAAEKLMGIEINTGSDAVDYLCASLGAPDTADSVSDAHLIEAFELEKAHVCDDDCRSCGCSNR